MLEAKNSADGAGTDAAVIDAQLAARIATGDEAAFRQLMRLNNRKLFRAARSILRNDADAEDAVQDAYLAAFRGISRFQNRSRLSTWLIRIVVNEALQRRRAAVRRAEVVVLPSCSAIEEGDATDSSAPTVEDSMADRPDQQALRAEVRKVLEARIDALPESFRTVFVLRAIEELSVDEVADALDIPEPTVRSRFFRARAMLREALAQDVDACVGEAFGFDGARCDRIVEGVLRLARNECP